MIRIGEFITACGAVARREWRMQLGSALGWSVMAAVAALAGTVFAVAVFKSGAPATLRGTFIALGWAVLLVAPALSMRTVVEEFRAGTWSSLAASPAGFTAIVVGKFAALFTLLSLTVIIPIVTQLLALEWFARPDYLEAATGVAGLLLAGSAYVATGILMSALVGNQVAAYLLSVFLWLTWLAIARSAPALLSGSAAFIGFSIDPLRRLDDFLLGLFDTGNLLYFVAITVWSLAAATVAVARASLPAALASRWRCALGLSFGAIFAVAVVLLADLPQLRASVDMTKSRSYTLAPETEELLASLEGDWRISVLLTGADAAVLRQVDEVLARLSERGTKSGRINVARIDPTSPADAARYEAALEAVHMRDAAALEQFATAIRAGRAAFDDLAKLAEMQIPLLEDLLIAIPAADPLRPQLEALRGGFTQLTTQKRAFDRSLNELLKASDARPFPDEGRAAAAIAGNLKHWSEELTIAARTISDRATRTDQPALRVWVDSVPAEFKEVAQELRIAQDALDRLPRLWGTEVVGALAAGDCAIISGPDGVVTVPSWQLVSGKASGAISFDRRFRGEQAIASALRSLRTGKPPVAVFVHAGSPGILKPSADRSDLAAMADALQSARIQTREWTPGSGPPPVAGSSGTIVWIIVAPVDRDAGEITPREREFLEVSQRLVTQGEPVLLSVGPSLLPLLGQQDPWGSLLRSRGMLARTGQTVLELLPVSADRTEISSAQSTTEGGMESAIGRAIDGQRVRIDRPIPIDSDPSASGTTVVLAIEPSSERWIEDDWRRDLKNRSAVPSGKQLTTPAAVIMASEQAGSAGRRGTRAVLVGSPTWMTTAVADAADSLGGGRVALRNPGNRDLLVNTVAWLAGRNDLMTGSGAGREVARLPRLPRTTLALVGTIEAIVIPALLAALGAAIVVRRRLRT